LTTHKNNKTTDTIEAHDAHQYLSILSFSLFCHSVCGLHSSRERLQFHLVYSRHLLMLYDAIVNLQ